MISRHPHFSGDTLRVDPVRQKRHHYPATDGQVSSLTFDLLRRQPGDFRQINPDVGGGGDRNLGSATKPVTNKYEDFMDGRLGVRT